MMNVDIPGRYRLERFPSDITADKRYAGRLHAVRVTGPNSADSLAIFRDFVCRCVALRWMSQHLGVALTDIEVEPTVGEYCR